MLLDRSAHRPVLAALGLAASGCLFPVVGDDDSGSLTASTFDQTTTTTGTPVPTSSLPTTTDAETGGPADTTDGSSSTGAPPPPLPSPRCALVDAPDLLVAACAGADPCELREVMRVECDGDASPPQISRAPGDDAALYMRVEFDRNRLNHEAFRLRSGASGPAGLWVTRDDYFDYGEITLLASADGPFEGFYRQGELPIVQFLADADVDPDGLSVPAATHPDIGWLVGAGTRPDDVPFLFFHPTDAEGYSALFAWPMEQVKQSVLGVSASDLAIHEAAGQLWMTWVADAAEFPYDQYLFTRPLADDPQAPGTPAVRISEDFTLDVVSTALSPFGDGTHGVVLTAEEPGEDPRLIAGVPWSFDETLTKELVGCEEPSYDDGCAAAPACPESHLEALPIALQAGPDSVRAWHLECPYDSTVAWVNDSYWNLLCLCTVYFCAETTVEKIEHPCDLVASALAPDPNAPDKLRRDELWRRTLDVTRSEVEYISAAASGDTLWVALDSTIYAVDTTVLDAPPVCGNGVIEGDEPCDGPALGAGMCTDFPGFGGGALACDAACAYDTAGCCKAAGQACQTDGECCPGTACELDVQTLKNICK